MVPRRWAVIGAVLIAAGAATALAIWRPWVPRAAQPFDIPANEFPDLGTLLDPARLVTVAVDNRTGGPCKLTIAASGPGTHMDLSWDLAAGESRMIQKVAGPLTIETIAVDRGGTSRRREIKVTVTAGQTGKVRLDADGSVEVVTESP